MISFTDVFKMGKARFGHQKEFSTKGGGGGRRFCTAEENGIHLLVLPSGNNGNFVGVCLSSDVDPFQSLDVFDLWLYVI